MASECMLLILYSTATGVRGDRRVTPVAWAVAIEYVSVV